MREIENIFKLPDIKEREIIIKIDIASGKIYAKYKKYPVYYKPTKPLGPFYVRKDRQGLDGLSLDKPTENKVQFNLSSHLDIEDKFILIADFEGKKQTNHVKKLLKELNKNIDNMSYDELQEAIKKIQEVMDNTSMAYCLTKTNEEGKIPVSEYKKYIKNNITVIASLLRIFQQNYKVRISGYDIDYEDFDNSIDEIMEYVSQEIEKMLADPKNYKQDMVGLESLYPFEHYRPILKTETMKDDQAEIGFQKINR